MGRPDPAQALTATIAYWRRRDAPGVARPDWIAILLFFAVACFWSHMAARWGAARLPGGGDAPRIEGGVLVGFGPVLGALVAGIARPAAGEGAVAFLGRCRGWVLLGIAAPILVAGLAGARRYHVEAHLDGAVLMASVVAACIGEELGWREWLYDALVGLPLWASACVTWALWLLWHFAFPPEALGIDGGYGPTFALILLAASVALAALVRETRASGLAAAWHGLLRATSPPLAIGAAALLLGYASWRARLIPSGAYPDNRPPTS